MIWAKVLPGVRYGPECLNTGRDLSIGESTWFRNESLH